MLGKVIQDPPLNRRPSWGETIGLGLMDVETVLEKEKEPSRVEAVSLAVPFLDLGNTCGGIRNPALNSD